MSHDLKGPGGGMGLSHRSLCFCFIIYRSVGRGASQPLSHESTPEVTFNIPRKPHLWKQLLEYEDYSSTANWQTEISAMYPVTYDFCFTRLLYACSVYKQHYSYKSSYMNRLAKLPSWGWSETKNMKQGYLQLQLLIWGLNQHYCYAIYIYIYIYIYIKTHTKYTQVHE